MRYFIIINPPQYQDNDDDVGGFAWAGEAESEDDAKLNAIADCEATNGWDEGHIDADETHVIKYTPDYRFLYEELLAAQKPVEAPPAPAHLTISPEGVEALGNALTALATCLDWARARANGELGAQRVRDLEEIRQDRELVRVGRAILGLPLIDLTLPPTHPSKLRLHAPSPVELAKAAGFKVRMFGVVFHIQYPDGQITRGGYTTEPEAWESAGRAWVRMANGATMKDELPHAYRSA